MQMYFSSHGCTVRLAFGFELREFIVVVKSHADGATPAEMQTTAASASAAEPRSYKRPFLPERWTFPVNDRTCVAQNTSPSLCLHIHAAGGEGGGVGALLVTCDSVPEKTELMMLLKDWPVEGRVTALREPAAEGCRDAPLNAGSWFLPPGAEAQQMGIAN